MKSEEGMKKMTIGERLKELRLFLGLTQEEMTQGIVSESFYSKVERGTSKINILDLLEILNKNGINLEDFFEEDVHSKGDNLKGNSVKSDQFKNVLEKLQLEFSNLSAQEVDRVIRIIMKLSQETDGNNQLLETRKFAKAASIELRECYQEKLISEAKSIIKLIEELPPYPLLAVDKLIAQYYKGLIEKDKLKVNQIVELIKLNGYEGLIKDLPKLVN